MRTGSRPSGIHSRAPQGNGAQYKSVITVRTDSWIREVFSRENPGLVAGQECRAVMMVVPFADHPVAWAGSSRDGGASRPLPHGHFPGGIDDLDPSAVSRSSDQTGATRLASG